MTGRIVQWSIGNEETTYRERRVPAPLERKEAELVRMLRTRDGIAIEKSADPMDDIQYTSERDLAIRNVDRESTLLRQLKATNRITTSGGRTDERSFVIQVQER